MKKLLLILLGGFFLVTTAAEAQSYLTEAGDTVTTGWDGSSPELAVYNRIKSSSSTPVSVYWRITSHYFAQGWTWGGLCDNYQCYDDGSQSPSTNPLLGRTFSTEPYSSTSGDFHTIFESLPTAAVNTSSWVRVQLKDKADSNNQANWRTLTLIGTKGNTTRVGTIVSDDEVVVYPNPARDAVNVIFGENAGVRTVGVYNLIGKAVKMYRTAGNSAKIELNEVPAGMYLLRLMNGDGQVIATRKFNHQ